MNHYLFCPHTPPLTKKSRLTGFLTPASLDFTLIILLISLSFQHGWCAGGSQYDVVLFTLKTPLSFSSSNIASAHENINHYCWFELCLNYVVPSTPA